MDEHSHNRILIISHKPPYPPVDGGCFAMAKFDELMRNWNSDLIYFSLSTPKHPFHPNDLPSTYSLNKNYFNEYVNTSKTGISFSRFLMGASFRVSRFYNQEIARKLIQIIKSNAVELVIFESIYSAVYQTVIKAQTHVKTVIRVHNIEHQIWNDYSTLENSNLKKEAYRVENKRLKQFEESCMAESNGLIFISELDLSWAKNNWKIPNSICIPVQISSIPNNREYHQNEMKLGHIGAMDWKPNVDGIKKFVQEVYPVLKTKFPNISLHLAGKSMPPEFISDEDLSIHVHGQVSDSSKFLKSLDVLVVPIESGSGIRIKILEAMALGIPVISTTTGIAGIPAVNHQSFIRANTVDDWKDAISFLLVKEKYESLQQNGQKLINSSYSLTVLQNQLQVFLNNILQPL